MGLSISGLSFDMFGHHIQLDWATPTHWKYVTSSGLGGEFGLGKFLSVGATGGKIVVENDRHQYPDKYEVWYEQVTAGTGVSGIPLPGNVSMSFEETGSDAVTPFQRTSWAWTPDGSGEAGDPTGFLSRCLFITFSQTIWMPLAREGGHLIRGGDHLLANLEADAATGSGITVMFIGAPPEDHLAARAAQIAFPAQYQAAWAYNPLFYKYYGIAWGNAITVPSLSASVTVGAGVVSGIYNRRTKLWVGGGQTTIREYRRS
jgi:hypothetical protein